MRVFRLVVAVVAMMAVVPVPSVASVSGYRAFSSSSWWNVPLPVDAPVHPNSGGMIDYLRATNVEGGCPLLAGAGTNRWGTPVYWADEGDPVYDVRTVQYAVPPEFSSLRIPAGARPAANGDAEMTVFDRAGGYVAWLHDAVYDATADRWTVEGGSIAYLGSNGLDGRLSPSDEVRNTGTQRGMNGAVVAARYDEVTAGAIEHVLRIGVAQAATSAVFPMTGSDGTSSDPMALPQGARLRIDPDVDLSAYDLHPQALTIATALQRYGAIVGDSTGAPVELKLEDTVSQGRGQLWDVSVYGLCAIPLDAYEVIEHGYLPPATSPDAPTTSPDAPTTSPDDGSTEPKPVLRDISTVCADGAVSPFLDVVGSHSSAVSCLAARDIAGGYPDGRYRPAEAITRGQMASFLARLIESAGVALPDAEADTFPDVDGVHRSSIDGLAAAQVVAGYPDGTYRPDVVVTRGQMALFLVRTHRFLTGEDVATDADYFPDDAPPYEDHINVAAALGLTAGTGTPGGAYSPALPVTRGQMALFLARLLAAIAA